MKAFLAVLLFYTTVVVAQVAPQTGFKFKEPYPGWLNNGGGLHDGLDFPTPVGTPVLAVADGEVINLGPNERNKNPFVTILHPDGISTFYMHIDNIKVAIGDKVKQGQIIAVTALTGTAGNNTTRITTYPHLHLEARQGSDFKAKLDPEILKMSCSGGKYSYPLECK